MLRKNLTLVPSPLQYVHELFKWIKGALSITAELTTSSIFVMSKVSSYSLLELEKYDQILLISLIEHIF